MDRLQRGGKKKKTRGKKGDMFYCMQENVAGCSRKNMFFTKRRVKARVDLVKRPRRHVKVHRHICNLYKMIYVTFAGESAAQIRVQWLY